MEKFKNYIIGALLLGVILIGIVLNYYIKRNEDLFKNLVGKEEAYKQLSDSTAKLRVLYVEEQELRKKTKKEFEKEINHLTGRIKILSDATFIIKEKARKEGKSDLIYEVEDGKYLVNEIRFENGPAIGFVTISKNGDVFSKIYNHEINVKSAVSNDEKTGRYTILNKAQWVLKSPSLKPGWFNKPYDLKIKSGTVYIDPVVKERKARIHFWNPRLSASTQISSESRIGLGVSLASFGKSKVDSQYKFLEVGASYRNNDLFFMIAPISIRPLPNLLPNTYFAPYLLFDNGVKPYFGININL